MNIIRWETELTKMYCYHTIAEDEEHAHMHIYSTFQTYWNNKANWFVFAAVWGWKSKYKHEFNVLKSSFYLSVFEQVAQR